MDKMNQELEVQLAQLIARCLYKGIFIYDVEVNEDEILLKYRSVD